MDIKVYMINPSYASQVCGHNAASTSVLKQSTGVWFNETSNFVDRMTKRQDHTYKVCYQSRLQLRSWRRL